MKFPCALTTYDLCTYALVPLCSCALMTCALKHLAGIGESLELILGPCLLHEGTMSERVGVK